MLGQIMWFKRFCRGLNIDFDLATDFDQSARNAHDESVQNKIFLPRVMENARKSFSDVIGLREFYSRARSGRLPGTGTSLLVDCAIGPDAVNVWGFHEFQLECLNRGFLSETFPYWACGLTEWTHQSPKRTASSLVHMRLGDCTVLYREKMAPNLAPHFRDEVYATQRFFSREDFDLYRKGLHPKFPRRHYAERGARLVSTKTYGTAIEGLRHARGATSPITFITDGYSRAAKILNRTSGIDKAEAEAELNRILDPVSAVCDQCLIGEKEALLGPTLNAVLASSHLITGPSLFAVTVKCALQGEEALADWTLLDEADDLSRQLQIPCLVDLPLGVFSERLEQLVAAARH